MTGRQPIVHPVKFYEKGHRPLEFIPTRQWFIRVKEYKDAFLAQGRKIKWHPDFMKTRYENWVAGLNQDWCVSRQRYFGVPFPLWYRLDAKGQPDYSAPIWADPATLPVDPQVHVPPGFDETQRDQPEGFAGDPDVMDTWATSSVTPQIQSRWKLDEARHKKLFPMHVRPQSHEIIRTWTFYTIVKAWMHENSVPWEHIMISGWVLDPDRKKMSKSKGNVVTPGEVLDQHTVDALRYWAGRSRLGIDTAFDDSILRIGRRLATKIFNASRFGFLQTDRVIADGEQPPGLDHISEPLDLALIAHLQEVVQSTTESFEEYEFARALQTTESAFWNFCDNYLELVKSRSYTDANAEARDSAVATLHFAISVFVRLFAPFMPYVTEEVWSWRLADQTSLRSVHTAPWPSEAEFAVVRPSAPEVFTLAAEVLSKIRRAKSEAKKHLTWPVVRLLVGGSDSDWTLLQQVMPDILTSGCVAAAGVEHDPSLQVEGERLPVLATLAEY